MIQLIKSKQKFILPITYIGMVFIICSAILFIILIIQSQYNGSLINLRSSFYDGVTVIGSPENVWQYLIYAIMFSILNGLATLYIQKRFTKPEIKDIIVYWIFGSSALSLSLLGFYLFLVLSINN